MKGIASWTIFMIVTFILVVTISTQQQVEFTTTQLKGYIKEFYWISETVAILLTDKEVYASADGGKTYFEQNSNLCQEMGCIVGLYVSPVDSNVVMLIGKGNEHYVTTNMKMMKRGSKNIFSKITIPSSGKDHQVKKILFHPSYRSYALALVNIDVSGQRRRLNNLYVTKNSGRTWTLIKQNIRDALWSNRNADRYDEDKIFAIHTVPATGYSALITYDLVTQDTSDDLVTTARDIFNTDRFTFLATSSNGQSQLYVSTDNGIEFRRVQLPDSKSHEKSFLLLDSTGGSVFLNVFESDPESKVGYGTVYQSDWSGSRYSHSLLFNRGNAASASRHGASDFHKIVSMEGVYIANVIANLDDYSCKECEDDCQDACKISSRITFDKGGFWQQIEAPKVDSTNHKIKCKEPLPSGKCPLNLHGFASIKKTPIHSHKRSAGLILATGNVGEYLDPESANTYLSRDAGLSWIEIQKGMYTYEITDNGGLLVLAAAGDTTEIKYSLNQGIDWVVANFTSKSEPLAVQRIHHHKDVPLAKSVTIQGRNTDGSVLIFADFSSIEWPPCKGYENPDADTSDYEVFRPHTYQNNKCLLGRVVEYVRRKRESKCYISQDTDIPVLIKNCECTYEDYDCDYYFVKKYGQERVECVPGTSPEAQEQIEKSKLPPRRCYSYYNETRGYRKVAGNTCVGGVDLNPIKQSCPSTVSFVGVLILFFFLGILISFIGVFLYRNSPTLQALANPNRRPTKSSNIGYNTLSQNENEVFGLDDEEDDDEPDEIDESNLIWFISSSLTLQALHL